MFIDPFGNMEAARSRGFDWGYPPIIDAAADLLLVTHEHSDHNAVEAIAGVKQTVRSRAGTFDTPTGKVVGVASEHDQVAGTQRGANVIYVFEMAGTRICHMGDFGQAGLRPEQIDAIGNVDVLFVPVGGTATLDGAGAADVVELLHPSWVVPMHYRTPAINFLDTLDGFLSAVKGEVVTLERAEFDTTDLRAEGGRLIV
ncbi:MAG: MBL fold metallo-hydrolase, partial [Tepidisphaerales bacterium]